MDLTNREKIVLEAVTMHANKGGSSRKDFCSYIAGATGFAASTSRDTLSSLKRKGALVGKAGQYYTLDSKYAQYRSLGIFDIEAEENGVEAPEEEEEVGGARRKKKLLRSRRRKKSRSRRRKKSRSRRRKKSRSRRRKSLKTLLLRRAT